MSAAAFTCWPEWRLPEGHSGSDVTQGGRQALVLDLVLPQLVIVPRAVLPVRVGPAEPGDAPQLVYDAQDQEESMGFDYDPHVHAIADSCPIGPTIPQQRRVDRIAALKHLAVWTLILGGGATGLAVIVYAVVLLVTGRGS